MSDPVPSWTQSFHALSPTWRTPARPAGRVRSAHLTSVADPADAGRQARARDTGATRQGARFSARVDFAIGTVSLGGELDVAAVGTFLEACALLTRANSGRATVDLTELEFIDAAGLGAVVTVRNGLLGRGDRLVLRGATATVARTFHVGRLSELLDEGS